MQTLTPDFIAEAKARADAYLVNFFKQEVPRLLANQEVFARLLSAHPSAAAFAAPLFFKGSAQEYVSSGFMQRSGGLYDAKERDFILRIADKFERVRWGMAYFSLLNANMRPFEALRLADYQLRTGWQRLGVPITFNQTVGDHHRCGTALAVILFPEHPEVARYFRYHDIGESVIGDFTIHDNITRTDKARIESLGMRLLTSSAIKRDHPLASELHRAVEIYDGDAPEHVELRSMMKDCDLLEMAFEALHIMECCPPNEKTPIIQGLQEFWDYIDKGITHQRSRLFFNALAVARNGLTGSAQAVWGQAANAVLAAEKDRHTYIKFVEARKQEWGDYLNPYRPPVKGQPFQYRAAT